MASVDRRWLPPVLIALASAASVAVYNRVPAMVALELGGVLPFSVSDPGRPAPREFALFLVPVLTLLVWAAFRAAPTAFGARIARRLLPRAPEAVTSPAQFDRFGKTYDTIVLGVVLLLVGLHAAILAVLLGYPDVASRLIPGVLGASLILMGNVMPRLRPNWVAGLRTKRTFEDPQLWRAAHRTFGTAFVASGVVTILVAVVAPRYGLVTGISAILASLAVGFVATNRRRSSAPPAVLVVALLLGASLHADAQTRSGTIALPDGTAPYEIRGSGPPVVLIHGYTQNMGIWDEQVPALAPRFRVIRYDVRGFGRSAGHVDQTAQASDLAALLDSLRIPSATLVGLSMGANMALNFAVRYPARVNALVLYGAGPTMDFPVPPPPAFITMFQTFPVIAKEHGLDSLRKALFASELNWQPPNRPDIAPKIARAWEGYSGRDLTDPRPPSNRVPPTQLSDINGVRVPVLLIHGDHEVAWFRQFNDTLMARLPNARRVVIANGGHGAHFAQPEAFNKAVLAFLESVKPK